MMKTVFAAIVAVLCLAPVAASADDRTPSDVTASEQAKMKAEADAKAGPMPQRDYINTPKAEQKMLKQKGQ